MISALMLIWAGWRLLLASSITGSRLTKPCKHGKPGAGGTIQQPYLLIPSTQSETATPIALM